VGPGPRGRFPLRCLLAGAYGSLIECMPRRWARARRQIHTVRVLCAAGATPLMLAAAPFLLMGDEDEALPLPAELVRCASLQSHASVPGCLSVSEVVQHMFRDTASEQGVQTMCDHTICDGARWMYPSSPRRRHQRRLRNGCTITGRPPPPPRSRAAS
jgi:hypothetical protein